MTANYAPSQELAAAVQAFGDATDALATAKTHLRAAVGRELLAPPEPTSKQVTEGLPQFPWSEETVRGIAREYGVKPKKGPTVKSIKPAKRASKTAS